MHLWSFASYGMDIVEKAKGREYKYNMAAMHYFLQMGQRDCSLGFHDMDSSRIYSASEIITIDNG